MTNAAAAWPVCTICYDDLRPLSDHHLHCLPRCGHVFHALCLEQWLEYCPAGKKKPTCPVCKQPCGAAYPPTRLYFQSTGANPTQNLPASEAAPVAADPEALAVEVTRLEQKVASLGKGLEDQRTLIQKLNVEVVVWRKRAEKEEAKGEAIRKERECVQQLLNAKMEELSRKTSECARLQEKSLALAKELAALKLSTDMNLGEEEIVKLASLGHSGNLENAIDVLKRSLALRNKSYKELMAQCNLLGRSESRTQEKLNKAKEQIKKLKTRLQEVEKELEEKENGMLRDLKVSKKLKTDGMDSSHIGQTNSFSSNTAIRNQTDKPDEAMHDLNITSFSCHDRPRLNRCVNGPEARSYLNSKADMDEKNANVTDIDADTSVLIDTDGTGFSPKPFENFTHASGFRSQSILSEHDNKESSAFGCEASSFIAEDASTFLKHTVATGKSSFSEILTKNKERNIPQSLVERSTTVTSSTWAKETLTIDGISKQVTSLASGTGPQQIHNANVCSDDFQTPGGILGPEGARRSIGKWCRAMTTPGSLNANAARSNGNLIAVGPDGRGGKVKILRDLGRFQDSKTQALWPKAQKLGGKCGQSQIENFFGRR